MNFTEIDKKLSHAKDALTYALLGLYARDIENRKYRINKVQKRFVSKITKNKIYKYRVHSKIRRIFAVCHPEELHLALGLCSKCYWKQHRDNAPPSICHPNKKTFRRGLCKPCYRRETKAKW
jgi:hypothetical protein